MVMVMNGRRATIRIAAIAALGLLLSGCATYYERGDGVYYQPRVQHAHRVALIDPLVYPYWSLDYFYFSHYYHPYSVVVHRYDPWYYPYPGWYYAHRPGYRYPWYTYGPHYRHYRPWYVGGYFSFGDDRRSQADRVRQIDARLSELETRRSLAVRSQRPDRTVLRSDVSQHPPVSRRTPNGQRLEPARGPTLERRADLLRRLDDLDRPRTIDAGILPGRGDRRLPESLPGRAPERSSWQTGPREGSQEPAPIRQRSTPPVRQQAPRRPVSVPDDPPSRSPARTRERPPARPNRRDRPRRERER